MQKSKSSAVPLTDIALEVVPELDALEKVHLVEQKVKFLYRVRAKERMLSWCLQESW